MYVYNEYWNTLKSVLLYPIQHQSIAPDFSKYESRNQSCGIGKLNIIKNNKLNLKVGEEILKWIKDK